MIYRLVPLWLVETVSRLAGYVVGLKRPGSSYSAEAMVRGLYWSLRLNAGKRLKIGRVQIEGDRIELGRGVQLYCMSRFVTGSTGSIVIGSGSHVASHSILSGLGGIRIGRDCVISSGVAIYSITNDPDAENVATAPPIKAPVHIGNNVLVGCGAKILPGVTIGDNAVIASGAVVIRDVPAGFVAKGVPAKAETRIHLVKKAG